MVHQSYMNCTGSGYHFDGTFSNSYYSRVSNSKIGPRQKKKRIDY